MTFDFSICASPVPQGDFLLDTIFYINGDETYDTPRKPVTAGKTYFLYTLRGCGVVSYNGRTFTVKPNTVVFMQPERDFSYRCKNDKWEFWWFEFFGPCPFAPNRVASLATNQLLLLMMGKSLAYAKSGNWDIASSLAATLLKIVAHGADRSKRDINNERIIETLETYIRENMNTVTVRELSQVFHIEERTLRNLFCKVSGMTPKQTIMKMRMEYGSHLLISTTFSLDEIARQLGFSSQYHFSRAFKEYFDVTPTRYRKFIAMW